MGKTAENQLRAYLFLVFLMLEVGYGVIACLAILNIRSVGNGLLLSDWICWL